MGFTPGSRLWLLAHEVRLVLRGYDRFGRKSWLFFGGLLLLLGAVSGLPLALAFRHKTFAANLVLDAIVDAGLIVMFPLMLSQAIITTSAVFYERGDLDLLLSSPLPPARILTVRCLGIALSSSLLYLVLLTPLVVPLALFGHWQVLGAYGVIAALGLSVAAWALLIAAVLFALLGPRRTKIAAQVLAAVLGAILVLASQTARFFNRLAVPQLTPLLYWFRSPAAEAALGPHALAAFPARAMLGEPLPFAILIGASALFYSAAVWLVAPRFAGYAASAIGAERRGTRRASRQMRPFRQGLWRVMIFKELRLIWRDPTLLVQLLSGVIYVLPLAGLMMRPVTGGHIPALPLIVGLLTVIAATTVSDLASITISAEDAPDLIAVAPVDAVVARHAKLAAAMLPVAVIFSPVLALPYFDPLAGVAAIMGIGAGGISAGLVQLWYEKPIARKHFRRRAGGSWQAVAGRLVSAFGWGVVAGLAAAGSLFAVLAASVPVAALFFLALGARGQRPG